MKIIFDINHILQIAALLSLIAAALKYILAAHDWSGNLKLTDDRLKQLTEENKQEINDIREEQRILTYGVLACLKGLKEQGCNGPVTEAIDSIETHLNAKAHGK